MAKAMRTIASPACVALPLAALLAACGPNPSDPGPGNVTVSEAQALDDAASMLDEQRHAGATAPAADPATPPAPDGPDTKDAPQ